MFSAYENNWSYDDDSWDKDYYNETSNMYNVKSPMTNKIESLTNDDPNQNDCSDVITRAQYIFNEMQKKTSEMQLLLSEKLNDNYYLKNQIFVFYILLFISIIIIVIQKSTISNLKQFVYILQMSSNYNTPIATQH